MARYIDADLLKDEILSNAVRLNHPEDLCRETTIFLIGVAPTADVQEVRHGRWVQDEHWQYDYKCSICGEYACEGNYGNNDKLTDFCPNCGADMRGDKSDV